MNEIHCTSLVFTSPDDIAPGIEKFIQETKISDILSVSNFITAVEAPGNSFAANAGRAPAVQYQFRFIVVYR